MWIDLYQISNEMFIASSFARNIQLKQNMFSQLCIYTVRCILYYTNLTFEPFCIHEGACIMVDYVIRDRSFDRLSLQDTLEEKFDE